MYSQHSYWSKASMLCTLIVIAMMGGFGYFFLSSDLYVWVGYLLWGTLVLMCLCALCFFPLKTEVADGALTVVFSLRRKSLPLSEIAKVEPYKVTMNFVRLMGSGSFFGWWGWFRNQELGRFMVYATNLDHVIFVRMNDGKKYVISCGDPKEMTAAIKKASK